MATLVLLLCFLVLCVLKQLKVPVSYQKIGRISMSAMLVFIGFSHFFIPENLMEMIPPAFPFTLPIVYITGILELLFGILLLFDKTYKMTGKILMVYFILIWPANIYNAINAGDIPGGVEQYVPYYHWIRVILIQPFFILWVLLSTTLIKK
ncbi:DoxX family membrane protein [Virgibacillus sp. YIM 98842]|uniref:DoxX family protein n=1 Tax=Virgibacillus sp. YIM 98842 TaxID=2663533 RepID=UPI0013DCAB81|nr:DoxX family membrane protein [Virgibacillus sp. YIM 98842]